jgi:hypothetical protein
MHFTGKEPGDGFYVRGDIGASRMVVETNAFGGTESENYASYNITIAGLW